VEREPLQETDIVSLVGGPETPLKRVTKEKTSVLRALLSNSEELVRSAPLAFCSEFFLWRVSIPPQT
jgi:hypothetical protein